MKRSEIFYGSIEPFLFSKHGMSRDEAQHMVTRSVDRMINDEVLPALELLKRCKQSVVNLINEGRAVFVPLNDALHTEIERIEEGINERK